MVPGKGNFIYFSLVVLVLLLGLVLRFLWVMKLNQEDRWYPDEYYYYVSAAENAFKGKGFYPEFNNKVERNQGGEIVPPPMQSIFLFLIYKAMGRIPAPIVPRIIQVLIAGIMIVLCAEIGRRLVSYKAGIILAFLVAIYPEFVFHTAILQTESNYLSGLVFVIFLLLLWNRENSPFMAFFSSLSIGLLTLQRGISLLLGPVLGIFALLVFKKRDKVISALFFFIVPYCVIAPWLARNLAVYEEPILVSSNAGIALHFANRINLDPIKTPYVIWGMYQNENHNVLIPEIEKKYRKQDGKIYPFYNIKGTLKVSWYEYSNAYSKEVLSYIFNHPVHFTKNFILKTFNQFWLVKSSARKAVHILKSKIVFRLLQRFFLFGGAIGFLVLLLWKRNRNLALIAAIFMYYSIITAFFPIITTGRYTLYLKLFLIIFLSSGLDIMVSKIIKRFRRRKIKIAECNALP